jgi:NAD(P)-dependent dehydrogenase (short-subunit alcohol dehydrogenase family)
MGLAAATAFARNGDTVYATMRDTGKAAALLDAAGDADVRVKSLDVTKPETFAAFVDEVVAEAGRIDVLVNNAGVLRAGSLEDVTEEQLRLVVETNLMGPLLLSRAVLPQMRAQQGGCIIMMSSLSGIAGLPADVPYTASKFGLEGATEALRHEVDRWGIRVALVEPGMYATQIFDTALAGGDVLPADYPADSPYRMLIETRIRGVLERAPEAFDPGPVGDLLVEIAAADGNQLRWPADVVAKKVLATMFAHDDAERDAFLREVGDSDWWSKGEER